MTQENQRRTKEKHEQKKKKKKNLPLTNYLHNDSTINTLSHIFLDN